MPAPQGATAHSGQNGPAKWATEQFADPAWLPASNGPEDRTARSRGHVAGAAYAFDVDARFLAIISPGLLGSDYFRDVADVLAGNGPPDVEKIGAIMRRHGLTPAPPA